MFSKLINQYRVDLHDLEGDYRAFNLQLHKEQAILALLIASASILAMLHVDRLLFADRDDLFRLMVYYRVLFILLTAVVMIAIVRTNRVKDIETRLDNLARKTVNGRVGRPDEIAHAIYLLADQTQSSFMTGQALMRGRRGDGKAEH